MGTSRNDSVRVRALTVTVILLALGGSASAGRSALHQPPSAEPSAAALVLPGDGPVYASPTATTAGHTPTPHPSARATALPTARPTPRAIRPLAAKAPPAPVATPKPTPKPPTAPPPPTSACPLFPSTNVWNKRVDGLPSAPNSATLVATIGEGAHLHPDFGSYAGYGIPYNVVGSSTARVRVTFDYADESDAGPYPIPTSPKIEAGSDRHLLMWDTAACKLYELFAAVKGAAGWHAGSGAIWDLRSNALRRMDGPAPMPPACPSCSDWSDTTRLPPV